MEKERTGNEKATIGGRRERRRRSLERKIKKRI